MELGEPDASGRRRPLPIDGSEHQREYDNVIAAIGQGVDATMAGDVELERWGNIHADPHTTQTSFADVFSGGDCVTGADIAVNAVAAGRRAAISIDQLVMGREVTGEPLPYNHAMGELDQVPAAIPEQFDKADRTRMPHLDPKARGKIFDEVESGFVAEQVKAEAERCMECGCRDAHECRLRSYAAAFGAEQECYVGARRDYDRDDSHETIIHDSHKCIQCGTCVRITDELLGTYSMGFVGRGFTARVKPAMERALALVGGEGLDKIVENCPVGALVFKQDSVWTLDPEFKRPAPRSL
jgi:formate dehydrogenase major subunit